MWPFARRHVDFNEEIEAHIAFEIDQLIADGVPPDEARLRALQRFGNVTGARERFHESRPTMVIRIEQIWHDIRYGARMLAKTPAFTVVSVVSLAIGIGGAAAVFSFADALLIRPLNVPNAHEILTVVSTDGAEASESASYLDYLDIRSRSRTFDGLTAFAPVTVRLARERDASVSPAIGMLVSDNFFSVMGVEPAVGRLFQQVEHEVPDRDAVVVLGYELWQQRFGGDPAISGRTVWLDGMEFTVIGVVPAGFTGLDRYTRFQFYAPLMMWSALDGRSERDPLAARDARELTLKGRLAADTSLEGAQAELSVIAGVLERTYPDTDRGRRLLVQTELQNRIAQAPPIARLIALLGVLATAVLLVACANVAGLLTGRIPVRARELAMRLAIGASRGRVIRQLVIENLLLAGAGGAASLLVAYGGVRLFRQFQVPTPLPISVSFELDQRVLLVSIVGAIVSAVCFGVAPAMRASRADLTSVVKAGEGRFGRPRWGRALLVGGQITASVALLFVGLAVYRAVQQELDAGPGFRTEGLLLTWLDPGGSGYDNAQTLRFFEQLAERVRRAPGVESATLTSYVPMDGGPSLLSIVPEGFDVPVGQEGTAALFSSVDEQYFDTLDLPVLQGRGFRASDSADSPRVAVINQVGAERYWPNENPVGKRFRLNDAEGPWVEIVGVARTAKYVSVLGPPQVFLYLPYRQHPSPVMAVVAASPGNPLTLVAPVREALRGIDAGQEMFNTRTMAENYRLRAVVIADVIRRLIGALGVMSLALAVVGLYGLVSFAVSRRTREIGVRVAIGAQRLDVVRMLFRQGLALSLGGLAAGLILSTAASQGLAATLLRGRDTVDSLDVVAFVLVTIITLVTTVVAIGIPVGRATRVDPVEALRME